MIIIGVAQNVTQQDYSHAGTLLLILYAARTIRFHLWRSLLRMRSCIRGNHFVIGSRAEYETVVVGGGPLKHFRMAFSYHDF